MKTGWNVPQDWWPRICARLRERQAAPGYIETSGNGARNLILEVNEREGYVELMSERSRTGGPRRIYRYHMSPSDPERARTHGSMVRTLWRLLDDESQAQLIDERPVDAGAIDEDLLLATAREDRPAYAASSPSAADPEGAWAGPIQLSALLSQGPRPPEQDGLLLLSRGAWRGAPDLASGALALIATPRNTSLRSVAGGILLSLFGLEGSAESGPPGEALRAYCRKTGTAPLDLYLSWQAAPTCGACAARGAFQALRPLLDPVIFAPCPVHDAALTGGWDAIWGLAGEADAEELDALRGPQAGDPALERAVR